MTYQIKVDVFEGPFDLLLYLIKKNEMDIYTVSLSEITSQYLEYIRTMQQMDLDLAGDFLVIAATLIYIKSQRLLPQPENAPPDNELELTEAQLREKLQEYQKFRELGKLIWSKAEARQLLFTRDEPLPQIDDPADIPVNATLTDLVLSYRNLTRFIGAPGVREVALDEVTVEQKIDFLKDKISQSDLLYFSALRKEMTNNIELVVTLLAMLELSRLKHLSIRQQDLFGEIYISKFQSITPLSEKPIPEQNIDT